tara:strand:- start:395 stop:544 length:150 start_codon:yes stop_codon:yes gene_type:complete
MTIKEILRTGFKDILDAGDCGFSKEIVLEMKEQLARIDFDIDEEQNESN